MYFVSPQFPYDFYYRSFKLGNYYLYENRVVKFIKVTPKGFNFLDVVTSKVIFRHHFYCKKYYHKIIPENIKEFKFFITKNLKFIDA